MASYRLVIKKSAEKEIRALPKNERLRVIARIKQLAIDPRGNSCEKLSGREAYRARVGNYRIVYTIKDKLLIIAVIKVAHRKDIYKKM